MYLNGLKYRHPSNTVGEKQYGYCLSTVFYDCLHTKIELFPQLAKPYTQGAKHKARFAQL